MQPRGGQLHRAHAHRGEAETLMWTDPAAIIAYVTVASVISFWFGARSKVWEWHDGYRAGREDKEADTG
jgi:hypothetical protein